MKAKTITLVGSVLIVLLLISTAIALTSNSKNKRNFNNEKLQYEALTSQKLQVSQDLDKAKSDLVALTTKEETASKALAETESKLAEKEKSIAYMSKENGSLKKDKDELVLLQKSKMDLDKAYGDLKLEHETALSRIKDLENSAIAMEVEKKDLKNSLENAETYKIDNTEIYGSRGNKKDKLTIMACRTKKLNLNFEVPLSLTDPISFKITTPAGTVITPEDKSLAWEVVDMNSQNLTADLFSGPVAPQDSRKIALTYNSKEKLKAGEYKIQIFSKDKIIGNCRLKLR